MIKRLLFLLSIYLSQGLSAQTNTLSPYSIYGLGDNVHSSLAAQSSMGGTSLAMLSTQNININNPAALVFVNRPTFNFDIKNEILTLNNGGTSETSSLFSIENFSFAFPLVIDPQRKRKGAFTFGLTPYARQGYDVASYQTVENLGEIQYRFLGEGGINSAFLAAGYDILADSRRVNTLSIGATGSYVFGSIQNERITIIDSAFNGSSSNLYRAENHEISAADFKLGLLYTRRLFWNKNTPDAINGSFSVGSFYKPSVSMNTFSDDVAYTFINDYNSPTIVDTVAFSSSNIPTIAASSFGLGFGFIYDGRLSLGLDFKTTRWSELSKAGVNQGLNDEFRASLGIEYIPDPTSYKQLLKVMRYRAGFSYEQTRLNVSGVRPTRIGFTAGLGVPIIASKSTSVFNIGTEYAIRTGAGLPVVENYVNIFIGLTFTPNQYDRWFAKQKYD